MSVLLGGFASALTCLSMYAYDRLNRGRIQDLLARPIQEQTDHSLRLQQCFEEALEDLKLKNNQSIEFVEIKPNPQTWETNLIMLSSGNALLTKKCYIAVFPPYKNHSNATLRLIFKHEIAHILKSHLLKLPLYPLLTGLLPLSLSLFIPLPSIAFIASSILGTGLCALTYLRATEFEAETFSAEYGSAEEIQAGMEYAMTQRDSCLYPSSIQIQEMFKKTQEEKYSMAVEQDSCLYPSSIQVQEMFTQEEKYSMAVDERS